MNDTQLLEQLAATDAYAPHAPLPAPTRSRAAALAVIERSTDMLTQKTTTPQAPPPRIRQGWLAAAAAFIVVLVVGAVMVFLAGQGDEDVVEPTTTTSAVPTTITTIPPPPVPPMVDAWQRVGGALMGPVVGTFDMTQMGSRLVVVGFDPGEDNYRQNGVIFASDDGINWTRLAEDDPALNLGAVLIYAVTDGGPGLVAVGMGCENEAEGCTPHATAWSSTDGTSWTRTPDDPEVFGDTSTVTSAMTGVADTSHGLVAVGSMEYWTLDDEGGEELVTIHPTVWTSPDGITWERAWEGAGVAVLPGDYAEVYVYMDAVAEGPDGQLVAVGAVLDENGESVAAVWTSTNGQEWERVDPSAAPFASGTVMVDVIWGANGYIAVGTDAGSGVGIWRSLDGFTWTRIDATTQSFDATGSLVSVAALDSGYITVGPHAFIDIAGGGGWVTIWTSPDGLTWDRVHTIGEGYASAVVVADGGIAVSGGMAGADNFHAAVWVGPLFDPAAPPADPGPPMPEDLGGGGEEGSPAVDPETIEGTDVVPADDMLPPSEGDYATTESGEPRLALGQTTTLPDSVRLDFLAGGCDSAACYRDANFIHPDDSHMGSSYWIENTPFHVRHGFINESETPLGDEFDAVLFITRRDGPESADGSFGLGQPYRFDTDYVLRGTAAKCGPGYWEQTGSQTCEWFVHDFAEGIPAGRYDFWTGWYAPCSAWLDLGLVESCANPGEITSEFHGSVNTPIFGEDYTEGWFPGPFEPKTLLSESDMTEYWAPMVRGWPSD
jgi:hypothetical protein